MARLFRRSLAITIAKPDGESFFKTGPNAIKITGLRAAFNIEKQLSSEPNTCELEITNLSERTRSALEFKPLKIIVEAGFDGSPLKQLFIGDLRWHESMRGATEWTTKIQVGDGERAYRHARVSKSFKGVKNGQVLKEVAASMGLKIPQDISEAKDFAEKVINGELVDGPSQKELTRILKSKGYDWSIQDGQLQVLKGDAARKNAALPINVENGMIGSPGFGSPPKKGERATLTVENILYPEIIPGIKVQITSRTVNGLFRAERVRHMGDTHGDQWTTQVEAKPL